jgi:exodeoxyribonuclease-3
MRILSWNVNGIRALDKKGFLEWLQKDSPDILCVQETKISGDVPQELKNLLSYYSYWNCAEKKGYSGVAIYTKLKPLKVAYGLGISKFDNEGKAIVAEYPDFVLIAVYFPHGGRQKEKLQYKLEAYGAFLKYIEKIKKPSVVCGDFNIAHKEVDLARPEQNKSNIMFTKEEREMIDRIIEKGFVDSFRVFHGEGKKYTWWPFAYNSHKRNIGWRIDYIFVSDSLIPKVKDAFIFKEVAGSDHCPVGIELDI